MAASVLVDASFLVALFNRRDSHHEWADAQASHYAPPWITCDAVLSETFHILEPQNSDKLESLLSRRMLASAFDFTGNLEATISLLRKYKNVPMSFADACLVRMTEILADPLILTTDSDFKIYRRNSRHVVPCVTPIRD